MTEDTIESTLHQLCDEIFSDQNPNENPVQLCVLGCSTSEVNGHHIGQQSNVFTGHIIVETLRKRCQQNNIFLAVQACEHLNRALVIERQLAIQRGYEIVNVIPHKNAGGAAATAAFEIFDEPVMVEHVQAEMSIDIGDTETAQHVKWVQIPKRYPTRTVDQAHVRVVKSRPKFIGGPRAHYE